MLSIKWIISYTHENNNLIRHVVQLNFAKVITLSAMGSAALAIVWLVAPQLRTNCFDCGKRP